MKHDGWMAQLNTKRSQIDHVFATLRGTVRETAGPAIAVGVGRIGVALAQIVSVRISTELLTPVQLGGVSQMGSLASLFSLLLIIPVGHYVVRGFLEWSEVGVLQSYLKRYLAYILFLALVTTVLAGGIQTQWQLVSGFSALAVALLTGIYIFSSSVSFIGVTGLNLLKRRISFALFTNLPVWIALAASPVLFRYYGGAEYWSLGQYLGLTVGCFAWWLLWHDLKNRAVVPPSAQTSLLSFSPAAIFAFSWPVVITAALWWIQSQSYRFVLDRIQGIANVGLFAVGYSLAATPIAMYEGLFGQFYEPIFYGELRGQGEEGQVRAWNNYARIYLPGLVVVGTFVATGSPFLAQILLGSAFRSVAIQVALWAAIIETMRAAGGMMYHLGMAKVDNRMTILPVAVGAVLAPLGVLLFGQFDPFLGTIAGLFVAGLAVIIIIVITSRRVLPISWPIRRIINGVVLSMPLAVGFQVTHWMDPSLGTGMSLLVLALGGVYVLGTQAWLFTR